MSLLRGTESNKDVNQSEEPVSYLRIFADFHNADTQGRLRLNNVGTVEDLAIQKAELSSGQQFTFYSEDLEADGVVEYSETENLWVAVVNWNEIRELEDTCGDEVSDLQMAQYPELSEQYRSLCKAAILIDRQSALSESSTSRKIPSDVSLLRALSKFLESGQQQGIDLKILLNMTKNCVPNSTDE